MALALMVRWLYESSSSSSLLSSRPMSGSMRDGMGEEEVEGEVVDVAEDECFRISLCRRWGCVVRVGMREAEVGDEVVIAGGRMRVQRH